MSRLTRVLPLGRRFLSTQPSSSTNVLDELETRGFVQATTSADLRNHLATPSCAYAGVDPSASSLHVGNLLPLLGLLHFRARGHHALALIGGATGAIGDPSGRSTERNALSQETLAENIAGITGQIERFFERGIEYAGRRGFEPTEAKGRGFDIVNNHDWTKDVSVLDFLRDVGKLARVNVMLARDSVKSRLDSEQGISFTEFSYQLLQANDFAHLYRNHDCRVQLGGSDQWGNIVAGIDMIKRQRGQALDAGEGAAPAAADGKTPALPDPAFGLTIPLLTTAKGEKFGKSAGNAVWLDESRTSVSDFYQFFLRAEDADVERYLSLLTLVPTTQIAEAIAEHRKAPRNRGAQTLLAEEVTELVHGRDAVRRAQTVAQVLFSSSPRSSLRAANVLDAMGNDPRLVRVHMRDVAGVPVAKLAAMHGLVKSRSEANRLIKPVGSGLSINDSQVTDKAREIEATDLVDGHLALLRKGRDVVVLYVDTD